jgi:4-hydroxy-2-oxoheptanedioate aldolase
MHVNTTKRRLLEGNPVFGIGATLGAPLGAEILALAGFDFVNIDNQHGSWTDESMLHAFRGIYVGGATPFTRVSTNDSFVIGRALDRGALGILVPMVNTAEEARAAAWAIRYPPKGQRSFGPFACDLYGPDYVDKADDEVYLGIQLETPEAIDRAEEIMAVEGIDGCWIGPNDLAMTMRIDPKTPKGQAELDAAIMKVFAACKKTCKIPGIAGNPTNAVSWLNKGFRFVTISGEAALLSARAKEVLAGLKEHSEDGARGSR